MVHSLSKEFELFFPKSEEGKVFDLAREAQILAKEPASQGIICRVQLTEPQVSKWSEYLTK